MTPRRILCLLVLGSALAVPVPAHALPDADGTTAPHLAVWLDDVAAANRSVAERTPVSQTPSASRRSIQTAT